MFVNDHVFLVMKSLNINLIPIMNMQERGSTEASNGINITISAFTARKINIEMIVDDTEF